MSLAREQFRLRGAEIGSEVKRREEKRSEEKRSEEKGGERGLRN
jgi:hypothetical protein